ncbi:MAG: type I-C CRISPR-associated protein Cas5 [Kiritimatiellae bacterium]|nr:type I-C CRISPR-associated protein Cas5 [Kiritimatiellia bacterium]
MKDIPRKRNSIEFKVWGAYALFSDPITRIGGEKFSYQVPTYEAMKGIVESIYWKPSIIWFVDVVRVMKRIQTESKGVKTIVMDGSKPSDLSFYTYLKDVEYQVLAHFEFNPHNPDLKQDWNENKHHNIAQRAVKKGGRRDIFLGTRECQGYVEPCTFGEGVGFYDSYGELDFGPMFHGYDYPNETGKPELWKRLWRAKMNDGVIVFPSPIECAESLRQFVRPMNPTPFVDKKNFTFIDNDESVAELLKKDEV